MKYKVIVQYFSFMNMTVERRPEMDSVHRWKWVANLIAFAHNTISRGCLGMYTAHVVYFGVDNGQD